MPFIAQVAVGRRDVLHVFGNDYPTVDGTGVRDYIHVVDLALGHCKAIDYAAGHTGTETINLGTGQGYSVLKWLQPSNLSATEKSLTRSTPAVLVMWRSAMLTPPKPGSCSAGRRRVI